MKKPQIKETHIRTDVATFSQEEIKPFLKDVQISCCGNSVCPDLARPLVAANRGHLAAGQADELAQVRLSVL